MSCRVTFSVNRDDVLRHLTDIDEDERHAIGARARERVLRVHTADHRAEELERHVAEVTRIAA